MCGSTYTAAGLPRLSLELGREPYSPAGATLRNLKQTKQYTLMRQPSFGCRSDYVREHLYCRGCYPPPYDNSAEPRQRIFDDYAKPMHRIFDDYAEFTAVAKAELPNYNRHYIYKYKKIDDYAEFTAVAKAELPDYNKHYIYEILTKWKKWCIIKTAGNLFKDSAPYIGVRHLRQY